MGNFYMEATQINYRRDETLKTVDQKLQELSQESAIDTDIAPVFKSTNTYHPGDLVYYRNKLYVFTAEHTGAWSAGDVTATDVSTAMNAALAGKADYADIAGAFSSETAYTAGDLVIYNGIIYRCTNDHTGEWDADDFSATTIGAELNAINSNIASLQTGKLNVIKKETGSGRTFTITFPTHGTRIYALLFGRFGYRQEKLSIAVISHASENEAYIMCLGDETATVSCTGHVVTVTTTDTYAMVDVVSPEAIS